MAEVLLFHHAQGQAQTRPGARGALLFHSFADASLPSYEAAAAALLSQRVLGFLGTR